jgi:2,3-bisphosphoglycerate-dependent phosphoglycerate mutase
MLALVRHGETEWNRNGRFTGWADPGLTQQGRHQARLSGDELADLSATWDVVQTSCLTRALETARLAMAQLQPQSVNITTDWRLNERHVGALEGAFHCDIAAAYGQEAVDRWRWGVHDRPPAIRADDPRQVRHLALCPDAGPRLPIGESLEDVMRRVHPWLDEIRELVRSGRHVVAFTHGTTLRALRILIERLDPKTAFGIRAANGSVVHYRFDVLHDDAPSDHLDRFMQSADVIDHGH